MSYTTIRSYDANELTAVGGCVLLFSLLFRHNNVIPMKSWSKDSMQTIVHFCIAHFRFVFWFPSLIALCAAGNLHGHLRVNNYGFAMLIKRTQLTNTGQSISSWSCLFCGIYWYNCIYFDLFDSVQVLKWPGHFSMFMIVPLVLTFLKLMKKKNTHTHTLQFERLKTQRMNAIMRLNAKTKPFSPFRLWNWADTWMQGH